MSNLKKIQRSFKKFISTRKDAEIPAFLGNLAGTVKADGESNVYAVLFNGEVVTVRNVRVPNVSRLPVVIGYDASNPTLLQVIRARNTFVNPSFPDVPEHSNATHQWPNPDVLWVRGEQILPGLAIPSALMVEFVGFVYYLSGWHLLENQTIDLSGEVPTTGANYVLVEADDAGVVTFNAGASVASREVLTPADIPTPTTNKMPLFAVKMYVGQTEILNSLLQSDIVDLRWARWSDGALYQPLDSDLTAIAGLSPANDDVIQRKAGAWVNRTIAQLVTDIRAIIDLVFAPIAKGVTNGDTHDHNGGDGAAISLTAAISGILPAANGGTGANNGAFVLTIPATGTAALLATANVFTTQQKIDGTSDQAQFIVQGHSTQTANLQEWQNSAGAVLSQISGAGNWGIGVAPLDYMRMRLINNSTLTTGSAYGLAFVVQMSPASSANTFVYGLSGVVRLLTAQTSSGGGSYYAGLDGAVTISNGIAGTIGQAYGGRFSIDAEDGTITTASSIQCEIPIVDTGSITNAYGLYIRQTTNGAGTISSQYGIYIESLTKGTNKYAILTNAGNIIFNETGDPDTDFRIESDTEANMLFLDSSADKIYFGGTTNGIEIAKGGDVTFIGSGSGMLYGSFYAEDIALTVVVAAANTYYPVTASMTTGSLNGMTFQNASELLIAKAGKYLVNWSMSLSAGNNDHLEGGVMVNTTQQNNTVNSGHTPGSGDEIGLSGTGILTLAVNDIVRLCVENELDADDIVVHTANLTLLQIGA